ncbi:omega-amidase, chloroplastic-like [Papaver somniferum]|uniref:omega-amidase, chloroplastic-like n=1 Tax=Papaver somniferum TaxID=3469 RepID=UPI000E6FB06D|nr:omega-amidase, chloroplastic-like [Papaver somniferum]
MASSSSASKSDQPQIAKFKIALCQISVSLDKNTNIDRARTMIKDAAKIGAKLIVLPEMWNCSYANENFPIYAEDFDNRELSPSFMMLSEVACSEGVTVVGGSITERCGDQLYNTCCVFGSTGDLIAKHRKIHLFDLTGDVCFKESETFAAGNRPTIVDTDVGRIGIGICHDLRFPELAMLYRERGADLICYPGAFNMSTGNLFWELVQRARAVDNQLFVATCSPARDSSGSYMIWGHSTLVGPFGEVIATSEHEETTIIAEIDYSVCQLRRENLPLEKQKRGDIYQFVDCTKELNSQQ